MLKSELRKIYKEKRKAMSYEDIAFLSQRIFQNYVLQFRPSENQNVHLFLPIAKKGEIDTNIWVKYFWENRINVFVPKMVGEYIISISYTQETPMEVNSWGILEPISNEGVEVSYDQVLTPLLYADPKGNRVGYGKGFYDRFFANINKSAKKIGLNYFKPNELITDVDQYDIPLDYLVLPDGIESFLG